MMNTLHDANPCARHRCDVARQKNEHVIQHIERCANVGQTSCDVARRTLYEYSSRGATSTPIENLRMYFGVDILGPAL
jgi:hypothetical protein